MGAAIEGAREARLGWVRWLEARLGWVRSKARGTAAVDAGVASWVRRRGLVRDRWWCSRERRGSSEQREERERSQGEREQRRFFFIVLTTLPLQKWFEMTDLSLKLIEKQLFNGVIDGSDQSDIRFQT